MNKLKKLKKESQQKGKSKEIKDGLKQSTINFKKVPEKEEENSDKEGKSVSNIDEKEALIELNNSKKGSKKVSQMLNLNQLKEKEEDRNQPMQVKNQNLKIVQSQNQSPNQSQNPKQRQSLNYPKLKKVLII